MRRRKEAVKPKAHPEPEDFLPLPHLPFHILLVLGEGPRHGGAVVRRIGEITGGTTRPSSGSLYLAIGRLEERGLIAEERSAEAGPGTPYGLTPLGRRVLEAETARMAGLVDLARRATAGHEGGGP
jgi:PadR family transcriptional regulator PadR